MSNIAEEAAEKVGGQSALAKLAGVSPQAVQQWVSKGFIPGAKVGVISKETGIALDRLVDAIPPRNTRLAA